MSQNKLTEVVKPEQDLSSSSFKSDVSVKSACVKWLKSLPGSFEAAKAGTDCGSSMDLSFSAEDSNLVRYQGLLKPIKHVQINEEERNIAPLIWWDARSVLASSTSTAQQYAVLGHVPVQTGRAQGTVIRKPVLLNTRSPWSAFLCGSQGSGKSHTLSCMLENCLLNDPSIGKNPNPLAGLVLHYDGSRGSGVCEAAYLCSKVKTTVLVSASNYGNLKAQYEEMAATHGGTIEVKRLLINPKHLDTERVKTLMAVSKDGEMPLYIQTLIKLIRDIAISNGGTGVFNYPQFKAQLNAQMFSDKQNQPLQLRLDLLESFLDLPSAFKFPTIAKKPAVTGPESDSLVGHPGELTIIDLTDPVVDIDAACVLFDTCLSIFTAQTRCSKIIALDEAHNYLVDGCAAAAQFTGKLLKSIREQRHQGTRIIIATQEPTLDTRLLDLCSITMVHRCTSPAWFEVLRKHIAGLYLSVIKGQEAGDAKKVTGRLFEEIVGLRLGESLLFCPTAVMMSDESTELCKMKGRYVKFMTRERVTADGGRTKLSDKGQGSSSSSSLNESEESGGASLSKRREESRSAGRQASNQESSSSGNLDSSQVPRLGGVLFDLLRSVD